MLSNKVVAVPETRQQDILANLLESRGAKVIRVPMVAIHDAPDPAPVEAWLGRFIDHPPGVFIILTGEGIRRLHGFAQRAGLARGFLEALGASHKLCRGPKPNRALRELGLAADREAVAPTTDGIIETLAADDLTGAAVAVQLYGQEPNQKLMDYLRSRGASVDPVAPYVYADKVEEAAVVDFIGLMAGGGVDVVAFTSQPQYQRLRQVAHAHGLASVLAEGLSKTHIAAVGPVVREQLRSEGHEVAIMPERAYFMKPLVLAISRYLEQEEETRCK